MSALKPKRSGKSATTGYNLHPQYTSTGGLDNIGASEYNRIKIELQVLRTDFARILNGYKQIGIAHADLLLDQPQEWRNYLLDNAYVGILHPDVREDIVTFLDSVKRHSRLNGAIR